MSTAWTRRCTRSGVRCASRIGSKRSVGSATGSSSSPELAAAMHRLRSTLARARAELELARADGDPLPVDRLLGDLREALGLLGRGEAGAVQIVAGLVVGGRGGPGGEH